MTWFALAASNVYPWNLPVGRVVRWVALALLLMAALGYAATRGRGGVVPRLPLAAAAGFLALALLSTAWSADPSLTLARALTLVLLFATCAALAYGASGDPDAVGVVLLGVLAGVVAIALGGIANLWAEPDRALVPATVQTPARYNGLGGNPNTMAMVIALAMPLAVWVIVEARTWLQRGAAVAVLLLLEGSLAASGSRGAFLGALAGVVAFALCVPARRLRLLLAAAAVALFAANVAIAQVPKPAERDPVSLNPEFGQYVPISRRDAQGTLPLEGELGFPSPDSPVEVRSFVDTSGRAAGWIGAVRQAAERPLLGYGFGTEEHVFVDRYFRLYGSRPENSYIGIALQLGTVGLAALLALLVAIAVTGVRLLRGLDPRGRRIAGACLGAVVCAVVLAVTQSYLTSVGSPATPPFWLCAFLLGAVSPGAGDRAARPRP